MSAWRRPQALDFGISYPEPCPAQKTIPIENLPAEGTRDEARIGQHALDRTPGDAALHVGENTVHTHVGWRPSSNHSCWVSRAFSGVSHA